MALYVRSLESQQKRQCREVMCPAAPAVDYGSLASWDLLSVQKQNERKLKLRSAVKHSSFGQRRPTWSTLGTKWQNLGKRRPDGDAWRELECPELVEEISGEVVSFSRDLVDQLIEDCQVEDGFQESDYILVGDEFWRPKPKRPEGLPVVLHTLSSLALSQPMHKYTTDSLRKRMEELQHDVFE